ncbi:MAG: 50S ribosomal protein L18 [Bacillota bacterium]|nr:50S ribosomal protein L18 [Bacillota bacterium]
MASSKTKNTSRKARHARVRRKVRGTADRPRLNVFRSNNHISAQIIDDETGHTLISASSLEPAFKAQLEGTGNKAAAKAIGEAIGKRALEKGIENVVFDRGGYLYHGRVKELAEGAREAGLKF